MMRLFGYDNFGFSQPALSNEAFTFFRQPKEKIIASDAKTTSRATASADA